MPLFGLDTKLRHLSDCNELDTTAIFIHMDG